ncbi:MAG: RagB/SusD protein [Bacteroidetes bacterium]|nr:RagB/SusD protein [Bacteroidota bacterium]
MKRFNNNQNSNRIDISMFYTTKSLKKEFLGIITALKATKIMFVSLLAIVLLNSCDDAFLDKPKPYAAATDETVYADAGAIQMVINNMYNSWGNGAGGYGGAQGTPIKYLETLSDEVRQSGMTAAQEAGDYVYAGYTSSDLNVFKPITNFWANNYTVASIANGLIEKLPTATAAITATQRNTFLGQAYFFRGQVYFEHSLLFGDVPLVLTTDLAVSKNMARTPKATVQAQAVKDMEQAVSLLPAVAPDNTIYYTSKYQAEAYLSYMYLAMGEWAKAEAAATDVINNGGFSLVSDLQAIFDTGSKEAIISIAESTTPIKGYSGYATTLNLYAGYLSNMLASRDWHITDSLANVYGTDPRLAKWYPQLGTWTKHQIKKYRYGLAYSLLVSPTAAPISQTSIFMRLAEVYLIRAEARAQQGNTADAIADINVVRNRATATPYSGTYTKDQALQLVQTERSLELSCEGKRWLDLCRWGTADAVMKKISYKTGWASYKALLPIPLTQIQLNPNLIQNPGY